jgi:hypothetical protein
LLATPVGGGQVTTLATDVFPDCLATDADGVYWADRNAVMSIPKSGGAPVTLAQGSPYALALDATSAYWAGYGSVGQGIFKVAKNGGTVTPLFVPQAGLVVEGCWGLALAGDYLVDELQPSYDAATPVQLIAVPTSGVGAPQVLVSNASEWPVVANATTAYWVGLGATFQIHATPIAGGPTTLLASPAAYRVPDMALASDGTLYWLTNSQVQSIKP